MNKYRDFVIILIPAGKLKPGIYIIEAIGNNNSSTIQYYCFSV